MADHRDGFDSQDIEKCGRVDRELIDGVPAGGFVGLAVAALAGHDQARVLREQREEELERTPGTGGRGATWARLISVG